MVLLVGFASSLGSGTQPVSAATTLPSTITSNMTLDVAGSPWIVPLTGTTVNQGVTLTVAQGVVVQFTCDPTRTSNLQVNGTLLSQGTSASGVTFTSACASPAPGDWIDIKVGTTGTATFDFTHVSYGGKSVDADIEADGVVTLRDSVVDNAQGNGIKAIPTSGTAALTVTRTKVANNGLDGLNATNTQATITDSAFWQNGQDGIDFVGWPTLTPKSTINGTSIWRNGRFGVHVGTSGNASGQVYPDGNGNNVYDNGTFSTLPTDGWTQLDIGAVPSNGDWTGNYWGALFGVQSCQLESPPNHPAYAAPYQNPPVSGLSLLRGPIASSPDAWNSDQFGYCVPHSTQPIPCCHSGAVVDHVNAYPISNNELDLYFKTPPPAFGVMPLGQTFGCLECARKNYGIIDGQTLPPNSPDPGLSAQDRVLEPVNPATGTLTESFEDIHLPGPGIPFSLLRTYNSRDTNGGPFGTGWTFPFNASLAVTSGDVTYRSGDGQQTVYHPVPSSSTAYWARGNDAVLTKQGDGSFTLVSQDQRTFAFDASGRLTSMKPRFGPATTLSYTSGQLSSVTDSAGRVITFSWTGASLTKVTLPDTRFVQYGYTGGQLTSVTDLRGFTWLLGYDGNGYLNSIKDPEGRFTMQSAYDSLGRVTSQTDGDGGVTTLGYSTAADGADVTTITPPGRGAWVYRSSGNLVSSVADPTGRTTKKEYTGTWQLAKETDGAGNSNTYLYDQRGNLTSETKKDGSSWSWTYNASNDTTSQVDGRGNTTNYTYAASASTDYQAGQLQSATDPDGKTTTYTYYTTTGGAPPVKVGLVKSIKLPGRTNPAAYDYDTQGNLNSIVTSLGFKTTMTYDTSGRMLTLVDPRGNKAGGNPANYTTTWTWDGDNVKTIKDARNHTSTFTYDKGDLLSTVTTPDGATPHTTTYDYTPGRRLWHAQDPRTFTTTHTYTPDGLPSTVVTAEGRKTEYHYDNAAQLTSVLTPRAFETGATPSDYTWTYTYDNAGYLKTADHPDGGSTSYEYDGLGRLAKVTAPLGRVTQYTYDGDGNLKTTNNPLNQTQSFGYDKENRRTSWTNLRTQVYSWAYFGDGALQSYTTPRGKRSWTEDDDGRTISMTTPRGNTGQTPDPTFTWSYGYDEAGNLTTVTHPLPKTTTYGYDATNNLTSVKNGLNNTTSYTYTDTNALQTVTSPAPDSAQTQYTYDADGNLQTIVDPNLKTVASYTYDHDDLLQGKTTPVGAWSYQYYADGTRKLDSTPKGNINYTYDRMARIGGITYADGTPSVSYGYDIGGRRTSMSDGAGQTAYTYDLLDRVKTAARTDAGAPSARTLSYSYDENGYTGDLTSETYPDGTALAMTYENDDALNTIVTGGQTTSFDYDLDGNLTKTTLPSGNGYVENRTWDKADQLTKVENIKGTTVLSRFTATLDAIGNPKLIATTRGTTTTNLSYLYDTRNRLSKACYGVTSCTTSVNTNDIAYTYDFENDIKTETRNGTGGTTANPAGTTTYTYDTTGMYQLQSARFVPTTGSAVTTNYTYDLNGNLKTSGSTNYTYNLAGNLTQAGTATFNYDGDGLIASADPDGAGATAPTMFRWDENNDIPQLALEESPTNTLVRRYIDGPQGVLSQTTSTGIAYLHRDILGSTTDLTESTGTAKRKLDYDPYGQIRTNTALNGGLPVSIQYAGQYRDPIDGSRYYLRNRYYDTSVSRFQSPDPLGETSTEEFGGLYAYVSGDPTRLVDPLGLCGWTDPIGCGADGVSFLSDHAGTISNIGIAVGGTVACATTPLDGVGAAGCVVAAGAAGGLSEGLFNGDSGTGLVGDAVLGGATNLAGYGLGKAAEYALAKYLARSCATAADEYVNLASETRTNHILSGDSSGGGHLWPGDSGKTPFPQDWSAARVMHEISDVATDPASTRVAQGGKTVVTGTRDGVRIRVVIDNTTGEIVTGYPTNLPRNP
jgi:RHS repeat-associated protein